MQQQGGRHTRDAGKEADEHYCATELEAPPTHLVNLRHRPAATRSKRPVAGTPPAGD